MLKKIAFVASIPAISVPIAVTSSRPVGESISDLLNKEIPANPGQNVASTATTTSLNNHIPKQPKPEIKVVPPKPEPPSVGKVISSLKGKGYTRQPKDKLADFNPGRELQVGGNTGLGCYRLIFGGKNYPRLQDPDNDRRYTIDHAYPVFLEGGDGRSTQLACSTSSLRTTSNGKKIYEFELAFKQGSKGFIEKTFVEQSRIYSQVVIYEWKGNLNDFRHTVALQRSLKKDGNTSWSVANPIDGSWTDLNIATGNSRDKQIYYSVWIGDNKKSENIFQNLGIKSKDNNKWFSIVVPENQTYGERVKLERFASFGKDTIYFKERTSNLKYESMRGIARMLDETRGSWKQIEDFCEDYKDDDTSKKLSDADQTRLREYCFKAPR